MNTAKPLFSTLVCAFAITSTAGVDIIIDHPPFAGAGVSRSSQLWQDPGPNGNDLDGDSVCFADFTIAWPAKIDHLEWWGSGAYELGFQIEFWPQDTNTIAYQPLGVFYYGGNHSVQPTARFRIVPGDYSETVEGSVTHFALDLATPIQLPATNATNPRWFICVIGLTQRAYYTFDWSQGTAAVPQTFQFIRGGNSGGGPLYRRLGDARALLATGQLDSPPQMRITLINHQTVEIAWDASKVGYKLVSTETLNSNNWTASTTWVNTLNGECVVQIEPATTQYFQLVK